jgi:hypothetical protein
MRLLFAHGEIERYQILELVSHADRRQRLTATFKSQIHIFLSELQCRAETFARKRGPDLPHSHPKICRPSFSHFLVVACKRGIRGKYHERPCELAI